MALSCAPSRLHVIRRCPGSMRMIDRCSKLPQSPRALEGIAAHNVWRRMWETGEIIEEGTVLDNGVAVTDEMVSSAMELCAHLKNIFGTSPGYVEQRLDILRIRAVGYPDIWDLQPGRLIVLDYKFGRTPEDPFEHEQLAMYADSILASHLGPFDNAFKVDLYIYQPRSYESGGPLKLWGTTAGRVRELAEQLAGRVAEGRGDAPPFTPGKHCRKCNAKHECRALLDANLNTVDTVVDSVPADLSPEAKGRLLLELVNAKDLLQAQIDGLEASVGALLLAGESIPTHRFEDTEGRQTWNKPISEVLALEVMFGVKVGKDATITPKQAIKAGVPKAVVDGMSDSKTSRKLVAIDMCKIRRLFNASQN